MSSSTPIDLRLPRVGAWRRYLRTAGWMAMLLCTCGAAFGLGAWVTLQIAVRSPEIDTPVLIGVERTLAEETLRAVGLRPEQMASRHDSRHAAGHVIDQFPAGGTRTKRGRPVRLIISLGPQLASVPELTGSGWQRAQMELQSAGLSSSKIQTFSSRVPRGTVIAQDPPPGASRDTAAGVRLLVSAGDRPIAFLMPDLNGRAAGEAAGWLQRRGFGRVIVDGANPDPLLEDVVTQQSPAAGQRVLLTQPVTLSTKQHEGRQ